MDLFEQLDGQRQNLLPEDGEVYYFGPIISQVEATDFYTKLLSEIVWRNDQIKLFGKTVTTQRKVAWYGDKPYAYTYSKTTKKALPWTPSLRVLKERIESVSGDTFNSCLLNLYHNGSEGMTWHSDAERDLKKHGAIASVSLGAERKFKFKHKKTGNTVSVELQHGSLLVMKGVTQSFWLHCLPKTQQVNNARINLTFRTICESPPK